MSKRTKGCEHDEFRTWWGGVETLNGHTGKKGNTVLQEPGGCGLMWAFPEGGGQERAGPWRLAFHRPVTVILASDHMLAGAGAICGQSQ